MSVPFNLLFSKLDKDSKTPTMIKQISESTRAGILVVFVIIRLANTLEMKETYRSIDLLMILHLDGMDMLMEDIKKFVSL